MEGSEAMCDEEDKYRMKRVMKRREERGEGIKVYERYKKEGERKEREAK